MKKVGIIILWVFAVLGLCSIVISCVEPYYFHEIIDNTSTKPDQLCEFVNCTTITNISTGENSYIFVENRTDFSIPVELLSTDNKKLRVTVEDGSLVYTARKYNKDFGSFISPMELVWITGSPAVKTDEDTRNILGIKSGSGINCFEILLTQDQDMSYDPQCIQYFTDVGSPTLKYTSLILQLVARDNPVTAKIEFLDAY